MQTWKYNFLAVNLLLLYSIKSSALQRGGEKFVLLMFKPLHFSKEATIADFVYNVDNV